MVAAAGGNSKDIKIRFTGENLLGPVARSVQTELDNMVKRYQQAAKLTTAEVAKRAIQQRDAWMKPFMEFEKATTKGWVRFGSAAEAGFARAGKAAMSFGAAAKKAMGGLGLAAGMVGDLAGSDTTTGKAIGAVGNIAGQAALGGMAAGPWGAVAFGAVAAVKELKGLADVLKDVETNAAKAKAASVKSFLDRRNQVVDEAKEIRQGIVADRPLTAHQRLDELRTRMNAQRRVVNSLIGLTPDERRVARAQFDRLESEFNRGREHMAFGGFTGAMGRFGGNIGRNAMFAGRQFLGMGMNAASPFLQSAQRNVGAFIENARLNMDVRAQTRMPGEQIQDQLAELEGMRSRLNPELYARRRQQIRMNAIGQLPGPQQTPTLAATEGRFITMGRRSPEVDELSALRRELKMHTEKQTSQLVAALKENGGGTDSL